MSLVDRTPGENIDACLDDLKRNVDQTRALDSNVRAIGKVIENYSLQTVRFAIDKLHLTRDFFAFSGRARECLRKRL